MAKLITRVVCRLITLVVWSLFIQRIITSTELSWRPLTNEELVSWYTNEELCLLNTTDYDGRSLPSRRSQCKSSKLSTCSVGMGHPVSACVGPFSARFSFTYGFDGYSDVRKTPIDDLLASLTIRNLTLVMVGDSVMEQRFEFLVCEALREGCQSTSRTKEDHEAGYSLISNIISKNGLHAHSVYYLHLNSFNKKRSRDLFSWFLKRGADTQLLIAVNLGLHWHIKSKYKNDVRSLLQLLENMGNVYYAKTVWLETTHQSFPNSDEENGYYHGTDTVAHKNKLLARNLTTLFKEDYFPTLCPRIFNTSWEADWKNSIAETEILALNNSNIVFWTTRHALIHVVDMHCVNNVASLDCTHFCYSPLMWQPLWHYLTDATNSFNSSLDFG